MAVLLGVRAAVSVRGSCGGSWAAEWEGAEELRTQQPAVCRGRKGRAGEHTGRGARATPSHGQPLQEGPQSNNSA